jgi:cell division protein ZapA
MSNITLSIGGRSYTVACAEGEERHVLGLGALIDSKLSSMGDMAGQSETRTLLFGALLLADELHEANGANRANPPSPEPVAPQFSPHMALQLDEMATTLENLASRLEA